MQGRREQVAGREPLGAAGPGGFSEVLYAFTSVTASNGSAFAGLGSNAFYDVATGIAMLAGRFGVLVPTLAVAGALAWRIADHTRAKDEALRVGATTRAVPPRGAPPVGRQVPTPSGRPPARNASSPRVVTTSTRLLEKDRP